MINFILIMLLILYIFTVCGVIYSFIGLIRSDEVFKFRQHLLDRIHSMAISDIKEAKTKKQLRHIEERFYYHITEFLRVDYGVMVMKFWRKPESFYPKWFLNDINFYEKQ